MRKLLPLMLGLSSVVCGVDDMQVRNLENRVSALEQRRGANGMINPPARPVVKDGVDLWLQSDALFMQATEDGVAYGVKQEPVTPFFEGRVKNISYDWSWGWRLGVGYNLPHDGWDMLLNYTWFRSGEDNNTNLDEDEQVFQTWTTPASQAGGLLVAHATGLTALRFTYLDFQMGREFFVSKWLTLRPYLGARGLWTHRNLRVRYKGGNLFPTKVHAKMNNRFRAGGLLTGLDTQWGLGMGWSVYAQLGFSLLYGKQRLHETQDVINAGSEVRVVHLHDAWTTVRFMTDLGLGLRWDRLFYSDAYRVRLQLGWEQHLLSGFDKDINVVGQGMPSKFTLNQGDCALSGLTFQARFDF